MDKKYSVQNDPYEYYEALFDPLLNDRQARRKRSPKAFHKPKVNDDQVLKELADELGWENDFEITYKPSFYEAGWLLQSLRPFFQQSLISDIVSIIKGGKEASVYCCAAHPTMEVDWVAAKVYRPRKFRGLTNDQVYREGRDILTSDGNIIHENKDRETRAIGKKSAYGMQLSQTSWLMHEYQALERLHLAGAIVPKPYQVGSNAILMEFIGEDNLAAPTLNTVGLDKQEAKEHFDLVMENVELMLEHNLIHADLSAYNILYHAGEVVIIDLPQVVNAVGNRNAPAILARDVLRICEYFKRQGVSCNAREISQDLWRRYLRVPGYILRADQSQLAELYPDIFGDPMG
jgi:RIO kinase 1